MDWLLFGLAVAAMAVLGIAIGLVVARRLTRWSDRAAGEGEGPAGDEPESPGDRAPGSAKDGEDGGMRRTDGNGGERSE